MEIITSHSRMDFDGMAGIIGAKKLYPNAVPVRLRGMQSNVHQFVSLHKEHFDFRTLGQIDLNTVTRIIMVDMHNYHRVPELKKLFQNPNIDIHIYDHHPVRVDLHPNVSFKTIQLVGSTATLFAKIFQEKNMKLTPEEATALALGIYSDTGNLSYLSTKPEDVHALSFLFANGADIKAINHFLTVVLNPEQKSVLYDLLDKVVRLSLRGYNIIMGEARLAKRVEGLSNVVTKLKHIEDADASFVLFHISESNAVHIVARSRVDTIDVGHILHGFGGGGHYGAAYAKVRKGDLHALREKLYRVLKQEIVSRKTVKEAMSYPVHWVTPDTRISELVSIFEKYTIHGIPVMEDEHLVGVISIRDVQKAEKSNLLHAPVKGFMSKNPVIIDPQSSLEIAEETMLKENVGRLPVMKDGKLLGIITRTDILRHLYKNNQEMSKI